MMRKKHLTSLLCAAVMLSGFSSVWGGEKKPTTAEKKPAAADKKAATQSLYGINWYTSLDDALKAAQKSSPAKPVFAWRMLGDLCGKT